MSEMVLSPCMSYLVNTKNSSMGSSLYCYANFPDERPGIYKKCNNLTKVTRHLSVCVGGRSAGGRR